MSSKFLVISKVEIQCACKRRHVVRANGKKEHPCRCGAGVIAKSNGSSVTPWLMHAPDRFANYKPIITKWYWSDGLRVKGRGHLAMP